jgi:predicted Zn-dependent peptidase
MDKETVFHHQFENGLTLLAQPMPWLQSAAFSFSVPSGCQYDPTDKRGVANFACEMVQRGCGSLNSRQFVEALEQLGLNYGSSAGIYNTNFGGALPAVNLHDAFGIFADMLRRPTMPVEQLEDGRMVCYQEIQAIEDDLAQQAMLELRRRHYGDPLGRHCEGTMDSVKSISMGDIQSFYETYYRPNGLTIAVAGNLDWEQLKNEIGELFGDWNKKDVSPPTLSEPQHGNHHIEFDSNQTHIALAWPGLIVSDPDYYVGRCAIGILSDGMSSRLFREVRERRGLCYTVFASCHSLLDRASVVGYCGTSSERAQESLDVMIAEINRLDEGVTEAELSKLKVQMRSGLIMSQESSRSRASSMAGDHFHLGRVRTVEELNEVINGMTVNRINDYLANLGPKQFDLVTLGKQPLKLNDAVSATPAK